MENKITNILVVFALLMGFESCNSFTSPPETIVLPANKKTVNTPAFIINVNTEGKIFKNNTPISLDSICKIFRGEGTTIGIIADYNLTMDKMMEIVKRLEKEKIKVNFLNNIKNVWKR